MRKHSNKKNRWMEVKILQDRLKNQLNKEVEWNIKQTHQKEFEGANKPGKLLA